MVDAVSRVPPHNVHAEESLLGAMLLDKGAIDAAIEARMSPDAFYKPAHGHVYDAILTLHTVGERVDPVTVADVLERAGVLEAAGGPAALIGLQAGTPSIGGADRYARIVEEHSILRRMLRVASDITNLAYSLPSDIPQALDEMESAVFAVANARQTDSVHGMHQMLDAMLDRLEVLAERGNDIIGVPTGYIDVDHRLSGLQDGTLVVIGGRPGSGKTAFALGVSAHAAMEARVPTLIFSLEMGHAELAQRIVCGEARVDSTRIRNGKLVDSDWPKISHAIGRLGEAPLFIDDNPHLTIMEIRAKARRLKSQHGLGLVVVDYVQLMTGRTSAENRQVEVAEISRGLKVLARELNIPVVALSQLSRDLERRADKRPVLSDLRESGALEQDADIVIFLYRDELYNRDSPDRGTAEIIVAKHRNGPIGVTTLAFLENYSRFVNMARTSF